jgi:hypothetical protein
MSKALGKTNLRPFERRLLVGVLVVVLLVVNIVFVWPHFSDWGKARERLNDAHDTVEKWNREIAQKGDYEKKLQALEAEGAQVAAEDQANQFFRTVQNQASISGVNLPSIMRQSTSTNEFFIELMQTFRVQAGEEQLVDFLYSLGESESVIRARGLSLRPNGARQQLEGSIDLVASYQKNPKKAAVKPAEKPAAKPATPPPAATPPKTPTVKKP